MKRLWLAWVFFGLVSPLALRAADRTLLVADVTSQEVQNTHADSDHLSRMRDVAMVKRFARSGYLERVPRSTNTYYIHDVPANFRYSRPWTKLFLTRLSRQFHAKFGHRLRVTSLVRTERRQRILGRRNGNAAEAVGPARSSHLTGATVDISKRFMSRRERAWMRDVLYSLREQGYLYAIEEFAQPTFHIMVYRSYPRYVKLVTRRAERLNAKSEAAPAVESEEQGSE